LFHPSYSLAGMEIRSKPSRRDICLTYDCTYGGSIYPSSTLDSKLHVDSSLLLQCSDSSVVPLYYLYVYYYSHHSAAHCCRVTRQTPIPASKTCTVLKGPPLKRTTRAKTETWASHNRNSDCGARSDERVIDKRVTGRAGAAISASEKRDREREAVYLASFFHPGVSCVHPPWKKMRMRPSGRKWPTGRLFIANLEDTFTGHGVILIRNISACIKKPPNRPVR
jgi:hypothetical protein